MRLPLPLAPGARVALVAPAGPLNSVGELELATSQARSLGWEPVAGTNVLARHGYLAGTDEQRLGDLNSAIADETIDGIWCVRGGYGAIRLLGQINVDALRHHPKTFIGYSDITALHAALGAAAQIVTFHGPTARAPLSPFSCQSLVRAVVEHGEPCGHAPNARVIRPGHAHGRLVGGNLALLAALAGTPYAPDYTGAILILEDIGEPVYRIDRMLRQLALSGALSSAAGIVFGHFTDSANSGDTSSVQIDDVLAEAAEIAGVPAMAGVPIGHIDDQWTVPLGALAELNANNLTLHVALA